VRVQEFDLGLLFQMGKLFDCSELKSTLNEEFFPIFKLFEHIMANSKNGRLLTATLETMLRYLSWIPVGYIFETSLVEVLITKVFPLPDLWMKFIPRP